MILLQLCSLHNIWYIILIDFRYVLMTINCSNFYMNKFNSIIFIEYFYIFKMIKVIFYCCLHIQYSSILYHLFSELNNCHTLCIDKILLSYEIYHHHFKKLLDYLFYFHHLLLSNQEAYSYFFILLSKHFLLTHQRSFIININLELSLNT